jgi:hypothetical protein
MGDKLKDAATTARELKNRTIRRGQEVREETTDLLGLLSRVRLGNGRAAKRRPHRWRFHPPRHSSVLSRRAKGFPPEPSLSLGLRRGGVAGTDLEEANATALYPVRSFPFPAPAPHGCEG